MRVQKTELHSKLLDRTEDMTHASGEEDQETENGIYKIDADSDFMNLWS